MRLLQGLGLSLLCMILVATGSVAANAQTPSSQQLVQQASAVSASASPVAATAMAPAPQKAAATAGDLRLGSGLNTKRTSDVIRLTLVLTLLTLLPAMLICMTPFVRFIVVLSMIRHAFGMPETPPNQVLVSLALFLTLFTIAPTLQAANDQSLQPFLAGNLNVEQAATRGSAPLRDFMLRQVRDQDIKAVYDMSRQALPDRASDVGLMHLTTAFMLHELRVSFKIGFVILLPFLLIDLVVSAILLSLGMLMVPPSTLSLPIKVLMFVLIDGWTLVLQGVVGSFH